MSDLLPVGSGEFLREGGDGALELQDTCVSLGQWISQALKLLWKASEFTLRLFQLGLWEGNRRHGSGERKEMENKSSRKTSVWLGYTACYNYLQPSFTLFLFSLSCIPLCSFPHPANTEILLLTETSRVAWKTRRKGKERKQKIPYISNSISFCLWLFWVRILISSSSSAIRTLLSSFASNKVLFSWISNSPKACSSWQTRSILCGNILHLTLTALYVLLKCYLNFLSWSGYCLSRDFSFCRW